ncbi:MAG TPA: hypothetical protein VIY30_01825 [Burkholderiaceae bacterium]
MKSRIIRVNPHFTLEMRPKLPLLQKYADSPVATTGCVGSAAIFQRLQKTLRL